MIQIVLKQSRYLIYNTKSGGTTPPVCVVLPVISGNTTTLGSTLSCTTGTWTGNPNIFTYSYQWMNNGNPIVGATNNTYVTTSTDSLANITCVVTASNCPPLSLDFNNPENSGYYSTYFH